LKMRMWKNKLLLGTLLLGLSVFAFGGCGGGGNDPAALAEWNGEWRGMQTFLDSSVMDSAYETVATHASGYTAKGVKMFMESMYNSDVAAMTIQGDNITFTIEDDSSENERQASTVTRTYALKGTVPMSGYEGYYWYQFEASDDVSGGYKYVVATAVHSDSADSMKHWHVRCGNDSFEALTRDSLALWWPTMVAAETTAEVAAEDTVGAAEEYASFLAQLPPLSSWAGEWVSMAGYLENEELMMPAYEATVTEAAKLGKTYTAQQVKTLLQAMYATSCSGLTITGEGIGFLDAEGNVIAQSDYACAGLLPMTGYVGYDWNVFETTGTVSGYSDIVATEVHVHEGGLTHWHMRYGDGGAESLVNYEDANWWPTFVTKGTSAETVAADALEDAATFAAMLP